MTTAPKLHFIAGLPRSGSTLLADNQDAADAERIVLGIRKRWSLRGGRGARSLRDRIDGAAVDG